MGATVRDYRPGDEGAAYFVCLKTGNQGDDGEPFYREDPDALGRIFVGPYLRFEPGLALMLEDEQGVCGYALAAADSRAFYDRYENRVAAGALCAICGADGKSDELDAGSADPLSLPPPGLLLAGAV